MKKETLSFKEESEAMMEVFMESMKAKFPEKTINFAIVSAMGDMEEENGQIATQVSGISGVIAYGLVKLMKANPQLERDFLMFKLIGE